MLLLIVVKFSVSLLEPEIIYNIFILNILKMILFKVFILTDKYED